MHLRCSAFLWLSCLAAQTPPPSSAEQTKLVAEFLGLDHRDGAGRHRQLDIISRLDAAAPLTPAAAADWRKRLAKAFAAAGRKLATGGGEQWFWDKPVRAGRYLVGGRTTRPRGLLVAMHGGGLGEGDAGSARDLWNSAAEKLGWVAIYPEVLDKTEHGWTDAGTEEWVLDLVAAARRTWSFDADRVFFAGHSMGGYGTWTLGAHHADVVAGLAPVAGAPTPIFDAQTKQVVDIVEGVIPCLRNVPLVVFQSDDDPLVPPDSNRVAVKLLGQAKERWGGFAFDYWEASGRGHGMPDGGAAAILQRLANPVRNPVPSRIVWQPTLLWKRQFYWLHWELPVPQALVVADVDRATNTVTVTTDATTRGLSVLLDERLVDPSREIVVRHGSREVFRGELAPQLSTMLLTAYDGDPGRVFTMRVPLS